MKNLLWQNNAKINDQFNKSQNENKNTPVLFETHYNTNCVIKDYMGAMASFSAKALVVGLPYVLLHTDKMEYPR